MLIVAWYQKYILNTLGNYLGMAKCGYASRIEVMTDALLTARIMVCKVFVHANFMYLYCSVSYVTPTSNVVERLFSVCKNTMSDRRKYMGPECLEASVILRVNSDFWLREASALMQVILNKESEAAKKKSQFDSPTISEITTELESEY